MDPLNYLLLKKAVTLAEFITGKVLLKTCRQFDNEVMNSIVSTMEKDTKKILDHLASHQESKVISAYQYIQQAMSYLQVWSEERLETGSTSEYYDSAIRRLEDADKWAIIVFNDKRNSKRVRIQALSIRLFCRCVLDWKKKQLLFKSLCNIFGPFFADRDFVKFVMGDQSWISKVTSSQNAEHLCDWFIDLKASLEKLTWDIIIKDSTLIGPAREFAEYFNKYTTFSNDISFPPNWSGLNFISKSNDAFAVKICDTSLIFMMYDLRSMTHIGHDQIWAISNHYDKLVAFDANEPGFKTVIGDYRKTWVHVWYAHDLKEVYAIFRQDDDDFINVFDPETRNIKSRFRIPNVIDDSSAYNISCYSSGVIHVYNFEDGSEFFIFAKQQLHCALEHSDETHAYPRVKYCDILESTTPGKWIGLGIKDNFLIGDVLQNIARNGVTKTVVVHRKQMSIDGLSLHEDVDWSYYITTDVTTYKYCSTVKCTVLLYGLKKNKELIYTVDLKVVLDKDITRGLKIGVLHANIESFSKPEELRSPRSLQKVNGNLYFGFGKEIYLPRNLKNIVLTKIIVNELRKAIQ